MDWIPAFVVDVLWFSLAAYFILVVVPCALAGPDEEEDE